MPLEFKKKPSTYKIYLYFQKKERKLLYLLHKAITMNENNAKYCPELKKKNMEKI